MNLRTALLGLFAVLTILFASTTVYESAVRSTLTTTSTWTTTITTSDNCATDMICAPFTYSPSNQVRIVSVEANSTQASSLLVFWVTVKNVDTFPITFDNHALNYSVPSNSPVLRQVLSPGFPGGSDITGGFTLEQGESYTLEASFPNTKAFYYEIVQPGTVDVDLTFTWTACMNDSCSAMAPSSNTTAISAQFTFA